MKKLVPALLLSLLFCTYGTQAVFAAPVAFTNNTPLILTSPALTLTALSGSKADVVTVNAGNIVVTMSSGTGGNFVVTSPRAMTVTGGSISQSCSSGTETETIAPPGSPTAYTLTPTGSACNGITYPIISSITSGIITATSTRISWVTDINSNSQVEYGTTGTYTSSSTLNSTLATSHAMDLSGLAASTVYHFRVLSSNGNVATSTDNTFTTAGLPVISSISSGSPADTSATITWTTNVIANDQVEYGTTAAYTASSTLNSTLTTSHSVSLNGLTSSTLYHYRVLSSNGVLATSTDQTFTTAVTSNGSGGGGSSGGGGGSSGGNGGTNPPVTPPAGLTIPPESSITLKLVNVSGTYYLIINGIRHGITNPGMLNSYGFSLSDAQTATPGEAALPQGSLLLPGDGSLVKSTEDRTVYLISNQQRYGFTSAQVFTALGFKFSSVLIVTNPELQSLPKANGLLNNSSDPHLPGLDINRSGTVYWIGGDTTLHPYPDLSTYNSWHIKNDFSKVVPANSADNSLPVGSEVSARITN